MRRYLPVLLCLAFAPSALCAQSLLPKTEARKPVVPEQELLDLRSSIGNVEPLTRAYLLAELAQGLTTLKSRKAGELYEEAARNLAEYYRQNPDRVKTDSNTVFGPILIDLVHCDGERAAGILDDLPIELQHFLRELLIDVYTTDKSLDRAVELAVAAPADEGFPFATVSPLIEALPAERDYDIGELFSRAVVAYQQSPSEIFGYGIETIIRAAWRHVPKAAALNAIDMVLRRNREQDEAHPVSIAFGAPDKPANSYHGRYQLAEAQLLPIVSQLDPQRAESMRRDDPRLDILVASLPDPTAAKPAKTTRMGYYVSSVGAAPNPQIAAQMNQAAQDEARFSDLLKSYSRQALAFAAGPTYHGNATRAISEVINATMTSDSQVAADALDALMKKVEQEKPAPNNTSRVVALLQFANKFYLRKDPIKGAKLLQAALKATGRVYEAESNPDDSNLAPKIYWASTRLYAAMTRLAEKQDPIWLSRIAASISDPEIKSILRIHEAIAKFGVKEEQFFTIDRRKNGTSSYNTMDLNL